MGRAGINDDSSKHLLGLNGLYLEHKFAANCCQAVRTIWLGEMSIFVRTGLLSLYCARHSTDLKSSNMLYAIHAFFVFLVNSNIIVDYIS